LESGDFAALERKQIQELERRIKELDYHEDARQKCYAEMRELQVFEEKQFQLAQATARLPEEEEALAQARQMLGRRQQELADQESRHRDGEEAVSQLPHWEDRLREANEALTQLENQRQAAVARRGYLEGQVRRLERLREEIDASSVRLTKLEEEQGIYQELVTALGRQGVQAMLIETVVPRLEEEANLLLGRMTDNRMHVKLETQRERRTGRGDPIETLEINVSDELGPRSYEMYSGGEAFRVNLALRIALSKVLAQRMGAPLPTLFIDEGFGTQDAAGRERILDVISAIQNDFDKIIVITHLEDLKDMFPVRIEVQKDGNGSTFWLS
jgi:exonuclease SbcC